MKRIDRRLLAILGRPLERRSGEERRAGGDRRVPVMNLRVARRVAAISRPVR